MTQEEFRKLASTLPDYPGIYKYMDSEDTILYIGKAKNIKKRLSSYFTGSNIIYKTKIMLKHARRIEYTITDSETDALLLECTLIKKFQPRYNVTLKDGKTYSYICITNERFPKVIFTRKVVRDGSIYFGPYTNKWKANTLLDLIKRLFPLRSCGLNLSEINISRGKFNVCLEYHIKNCDGPCVGFETEEQYKVKIEQIKYILRGHLAQVKEYLMNEIQNAAAFLDFERAQSLKEKMSAFEDYQAKSTVVSTSIRDVDVFAMESNTEMSYVNYLKIIDGSVVNTHTLEIINNLTEDKEEILSFVVDSLREQFNSIAPEIIVPYPIVFPNPSVQITVPKVGDKKKLLEMAQKNVRYFILQQQQEALNKLKKLPSTERILKTLQQDLKLNALPLHIECFDNSNIQGAFPVASCVVFKNAKPSKADYRHFNIKTVIGPNDFASMVEVVTRRYTRMIEEKMDLPQLIIVDGGKGQLSVATEALRQLGILDKVTVIGIAKRLEEIFFPGDSIPIYINKKSESLKLIQQLRNEAHRFAITFHRDQRSRNFTKTALTDIPGIGTKTAEVLLKEFGSVKKVMAASNEELLIHIGKSNLAKIRSYFEPE